MRRSILASLLIIALCVVESLAAQAPIVRRGARVRVTVPQVSRKPLLGVVDSVGDGAMMLQISPVIRTTIYFSHVTRLEVAHTGKRPTWAKTAPLWLPLSAGGVGAILAYATEPDDGWRDLAAAAGGVLGATAGLLAGAVIALTVRNEVWEPVIDNVGGSRASAAPSLYVASASRGMRLGLRAAF